MGFLVLAGAYYILSEGTVPDKKPFYYGLFGILNLNTGLMIMSGALLIAGMLQTYLGHVLGIDYVEINRLINPYLMIRGLGGAMFTLGDMFLCWRIIKAWRETNQLNKAAK
jgi:nitric oxide reductase subunit B